MSMWKAYQPINYARILILLGFLTAFQLILLPAAVMGGGVNLNSGDLDGEWVLISFSGQKVPTRPKVFFRLEGDVLSGHDGCNGFGGPVSPSAQIRTGGRGCPADHRPFPLDLGDPMAHLATATQKGDRLTLPLAEGGEAVFERRAD